MLKLILQQLRECSLSYWLALIFNAWGLMILVLGWLMYLSHFIHQPILTALIWLAVMSLATGLFIRFMLPLWLKHVLKR